LLTIVIPAKAGIQFALQRSHYLDAGSSTA